jgi:hypothetical protein
VWSPPLAFSELPSYHPAEAARGNPMGYLGAHRPMQGRDSWLKHKHLAAKLVTHATQHIIINRRERKARKGINIQNLAFFATFAV